MKIVVDVTDLGRENAATLAAKLDQLADGSHVVLGEFSENDNPVATEADVEAAGLRELAEVLRGYASGDPNAAAADVVLRGLDAGEDHRDWLWVSQVIRNVSRNPGETLNEFCEETERTPEQVELYRKLLDKIGNLLYEAFE